MFLGSICTSSPHHLFVSSPIHRFTASPRHLVASLPRLLVTNDAPNRTQGPVRGAEAGQCPCSHREVLVRVHPQSLFAPFCQRILGVGFPSAHSRLLALYLRGFCLRQS